MEKPHVVKEMTLGATKVKICDNACRDKTPEEVQDILDDVVRIAASGKSKDGGKATA